MKISFQRLLNWIAIFKFYCNLKIDITEKFVLCNYSEKLQLEAQEHPIVSKINFLNQQKNIKSSA